MEPQRFINRMMMYTKLFLVIKQLVLLADAYRAKDVEYLLDTINEEMGKYSQELADMYRKGADNNG